MLEILQISIRDGLILFPLVLGVGLLYSHQRVLDVSVDAVAITAGIAAAYVWRGSGSYSLSIGAAVASGVGCSLCVCLLHAVLGIDSIMAGLVFAIAAYSISIIVVGESITLADTALLPGFITTPWWLLCAACAVALGSQAFFATRLGGEIRAFGQSGHFNTSYHPVHLRAAAYGLSGALYGLSAGLYVHAQGLARSGGGFEFLIIALCAYLCVDRVIQRVHRAVHMAYEAASPSGQSRHVMRYVTGVLLSPAFKAGLGAVFIQMVVLVTIMRAPNPSSWKLLMAAVIAACLVHWPEDVRRAFRKRTHGVDIPRDARRCATDALELEHMSKTYDVGVERRAVFADASCTFDIGVSLLRGPNGSGKSTLLHLIKGTVECDSGIVWMHNEHLSRQPACRRPVYMVRQNPFQSLAQDLTVDENLALARPRNGGACGGFLTGKVARELLFVRLQELGVEPIEQSGSAFWLKPVSSLSGGQAACVANYMALLSEKPVVLLDEPTTGLDERNFSRLVALISALARERVLLVTTHDDRLRSLPVTDYVVGRGAVLRQGAPAHA